MVFRYIIAIFRLRLKTNALKGQNHQHRATPCDWITGTIQALNRKPERLSSTNVKGRQQMTCRITPFQGLDMCVHLFHRALPDADAKRLSALTTVKNYLFFIPKKP